MEAVQSLVQEVKAASPKTKVIVPKYFETIPFQAITESECAAISRDPAPRPSSFLTSPCPSSSVK